MSYYAAVTGEGLSFRKSGGWVSGDRTEANGTELKSGGWRRVSLGNIPHAE